MERVGRDVMRMKGKWKREKKKKGMKEGGMERRNEGKKKGRRDSS